MKKLQCEHRDSFWMQEHIQQVSLSELMTSWSHILPDPFPHFDKRGANGRCVSVHEREESEVLEGLHLSLKMD